MQWKNLKENLKRSLNKRNRLTRSGAAAHSLPKCKHSASFMFLSDKISKKETSSYISWPLTINELVSDASPSPLSAPLPSPSFQPVHTLPSTAPTLSFTPVSSASEASSCPLKRSFLKHLVVVSMQKRRTCH